MSMLRKRVMAEVGTAESMEQFVKQGHDFLRLRFGRCRIASRRAPGLQYVKDDRGKRLLALVETLSEIGRLTAGPPGIPATVLAVEREALAAAMKDPLLLAEAKKLNLDNRFRPPAIRSNCASKRRSTSPRRPSPPSNLPPADDISQDEPAVLDLPE